jgi:hypothetical protein
MNSKVENLRKNFETQMEQVSKQIDAGRSQLDQLISMREQLKGALFALGSLLENVESPTEAKKEG